MARRSGNQDSGSEDLDAKLDEAGITHKGGGWYEVPGVEDPVQGAEEALAAANSEPVEADPEPEPEPEPKDEPKKTSPSNDATEGARGVGFHRG